MADETKEKKDTIKRFFTKGGTTVEFDEEQGEEKITLATKDNLSFTMKEKNGNILIDVNGALITVDQKEGKMRIEVKNGISLETGSSSFAMKPDGGIDMEGEKICIKGDAIQLKSKSALQLEGIATEIKGEAETNISGGGILKMTAAMINMN